MSAKIKAAVLRAKGELVIEEIDKPTLKLRPNPAIPGELGDILIKVKAVALNPYDW
jgi:NADPH:quinone reductase-like Zn-dependent oxidoreductase